MFPCNSLPVIHREKDVNLLNQGRSKILDRRAIGAFEVAAVLLTSKMSDPQAAAEGSEPQISEPHRVLERSRRKQDPAKLSDEFFLYEDMADKWIRHNWRQVAWMTRNGRRGWHYRPPKQVNRLTDIWIP
jgi:hypothetical protein